MIRPMLLAALLLVLPGCAAVLETIAQKQQQVRAAMWGPQLDAARSAAAAAPGQYQPAAQFAYAALGMIRAGAVPEADRAALVSEAEGYLQAAITGEPNLGWAAWNDIGRLRHFTGDSPGGIEAFEASHAAEPNLGAVDDWLGAVQATGGAVSDTCARLRQDTGEANRVALMGSCASHGDTLQWASSADQVAYQQAQAEAAARAAQLAAEREAAYAAQQAAYSSAPSAGSGGGSSTSSAPSVGSVSLKNTCPQTVKLFFGDKPKYGSGRYTSLSANTITSESMRAGDMIWIVDDSQNGLSSFSASGTSQRVEINSNCTGFIAR